MKDINFTPFASALTYISGSIAEWRVRVQLIRARAITAADIPLQSRAEYMKSLQILVEAADQLRLKGASIAAKRAFDQCMDLLAIPMGFDAHRLEEVCRLGERAVFAFMDELTGRKFYELSDRHAQFFSEQYPFGEGVDAAFPSAAYDIGEAGKCLALARWTASVMHLMRVLEVGLRALSDHYGIPPAENWNATLNQIEKIEAKSREVGKRTHGADEEKWAAEAAIHLRFIKNAWRNHAMHPLEKYDEERAVSIFDNARSFMRHLGEKLSE
jgi:hypothetical protein